MQTLLLCCFLGAFLFSPAVRAESISDALIRKMVEAREKEQGLPSDNYCSVTFGRETDQKDRDFKSVSAGGGISLAVVKGELKVSKRIELTTSFLRGEYASIVGPSCEKLLNPDDIPGKESVINTQGPRQSYLMCTLRRAVAYDKADGWKVRQSLGVDIAGGAIAVGADSEIGKRKGITTIAEATDFSKLVPIPTGQPFDVTEAFKTCAKYRTEKQEEAVLHNAIQAFRYSYQIQADENSTCFSDEACAKSLAALTPEDRKAVRRDWALKDSFVVRKRNPFAGVEDEFRFDSLGDVTVAGCVERLGPRRLECGLYLKEGQRCYSRYDYFLDAGYRYLGSPCAPGLRCDFTGRCQPQHSPSIEFRWRKIHPGDAHF